MASTYLIRRALPGSSDDLRLDGALWSQGEELEIAHFHSRSSEHHPRTRVRILHDDANMLVRFEVDDRYVICRKRQYQEMVFLDSCVEIFFQPRAELGHFNLEINCGGTILFYYVEDPRRLPTGLAKFTPMSPEVGAQIQVLHSMPAVVVPERAERTRWVIACRIPFSVLEPFVGSLGNVSQTAWRGNLYKCADHCSHPHWGSWSPLGEELNFHDRVHFGLFTFE